MVPEGQGLHPGRSDRRGGGMEDAADHSAVGENVKVILVPRAGWARDRRALED
jgi:hypothetical protein